MAGVAAMAAIPAMAKSAKKDLYDRSLVIDSLCFGRDWGEEVFTALSETGYSGIIESLEREDLQTAIDELLMWRRRVEENSDQLLLALSAQDFERAKQSGRTAVLMNFQDATNMLAFPPTSRRRASSHGQPWRNGTSPAWSGSNRATKYAGRRGYLNWTAPTASATCKRCWKGVAGAKRISNCCWDRTGCACSGRRLAE
jgi:hypothetical protein